MDDLNQTLPKTPKATPTRVRLLAVDPALDNLKKGTCTARQTEQINAAQVVFSSSGHSFTGTSSYTTCDFIKEAVIYLSPYHSTRQISSIYKSICEQYEQFSVDLQAPAPLDWTDATSDNHNKHAVEQFLRTFTKVAYAKTLKTHRMSMRSIFSSCKDLVRRRASTYRASHTAGSPFPVSPFSLSSTPSSEVFDSFCTSSPLQDHTQFTPTDSPLTTNSDPEFGCARTPLDETFLLFDRVLDSRTQYIINLEFKLDYLNNQCVMKDSRIAELEGVDASDACATFGKRKAACVQGGDLVLDQLQHLGQRISELRHEIECTELLIKLKDMRIAQLLVMRGVDVAVVNAHATNLSMKRLLATHTENCRDIAVAPRPVVLN